jgi:hypothetical protein
MPHFMASYRLVYGSRDMILRHKWASIYVPAILVAYIALALWDAQNSDAQHPPALAIILIAVASGYLAWHYTGQVWGMMASFAYLGGMRFERVRASSHSLGVAHPAGVARHLVPLYPTTKRGAGTTAVRVDQQRDDRCVLAGGRRTSVDASPGWPAATLHAPLSRGSPSSCGTPLWRATRGLSFGCRSRTHSNTWPSPCASR